MDPKTTTSEGLAKQIAEISDPKSYENMHVKWARQKIDYEESSGADVQYYAEYFSKFGSYHLQPSAHYHSFWAQNDIDIKLMLASPFILLGLVIYIYVCYCCCKKK